MAVLAPLLALIGGCAVMVRRVEVHGESMLPTLHPGDRLLVVRVPSCWPLRTGSLVAAPDPRGSRGQPRLLVKRVVGRGPGVVEIRGENAEQSTDSRDFGPVPRRTLFGVVVYRYAPGDRSGRIRAGVETIPGSAPTR